MLASLLIVFREALEAGLVVGIVLAATEGVPRRGRWIAAGVGAGAIGAALVAMFAAVIAEALEGVGQEAFTATILLVAAVMLGWHNVWMASHGRELAARMSATGTAVKNGAKTMMALSVVVAVAILREGSEVVLFLYGIAMASTEPPIQMFIGGILGLGLATLAARVLYRGLVAIPWRYLFTVTNWLIALLAAGMAGQAAAVLASADIIPSWGTHLWNTSFILRDSSWAGSAMHALVGYSAEPVGVQVAAYLATLLTLLGLARLARGRRRLRGATLLVACTALLFTTLPAIAQGPLHLSIRSHRFQPDHLDVPAGVKFKLMVRNEDPTPEEFESFDLNREKIVPPGQEIPVFLGPLGKGDYKFFGDFHQDTAQGVLSAK